MTNKELIEKLQKLPPDALVLIFHEDCGWQEPVAASHDNSDNTIVIE
jgi:hypothetical protein